MKMFASRIAIVGVLTGILSLASAQSELVCPNEKGPCCDLDWAGQGATIVRMEGEVLVSQSPTVPAFVGIRVENGGRVMTLENSIAVVAYDDGCWHVMEENEVLTIEDVSPCCAVPLIPVAPIAAPAAGVPPWLAPAAAALVVGGVIWANSDDDGGGGVILPISPDGSQ